MSDPPGRLLASGRSADVYDLGDGTVLRRRRTGPIPEREVVAMRIAAAAGYPAPRVHGTDGTDMVLDRLDGETMLELMGRRPWQARRLARRLAALHVQLSAIPPSDDLDGDGPRESVVHGDLHPGNVMMTAAGPVVIDWEGASAGPADADAATTWMLSSTAEVDDLAWYLRPIVGFVRRRFAATFLDHAGSPSRETVDRVCAGRLHDPNMRPAERDRIAAFAERHGTGGDARLRP